METRRVKYISWVARGYVAVTPMMVGSSPEPEPEAPGPPIALDSPVVVPGAAFALDLSVVSEAALEVASV